MFLNPTLSRYLVTWDVFYIRGTRIHSVVGWLIIVVTVITVSRKAGSCSLIKPLRARHTGWRRRRLRHIDWSFSSCVSLFGLLRSLSLSLHGGGVFGGPGGSGGVLGCRVEPDDRPGGGTGGALTGGWALDEDFGPDDCWRDTGAALY